MSADDKITDLQLPIASVARLIKEALPSGAIAKQEAKLAITRAASVFILFLTSGKCRQAGIHDSRANRASLISLYIAATIDVTTAANQKTLTATHVFNALKDIEFENFIPELEKSLENYRRVMKEKKDRKSINDNAAAEKATEEDDDDDVEMIEDD
jgi:DNA polymerase epsilon subunit 3